MSQKKPIFGYWTIRGLGHPIRFLLQYLEVDYEEKLYDHKHRDEWFAEKEKFGFLFPNVPYILDGENRVTESRAIMKYLCRTRNQSELLGKTLEVQTKVDMLDYYIYDFLELGLCGLTYNYTEERHKKYNEEDAPKKFQYLSNFIGDNKWATGNDITYVDFLTYEILFQMTVFNPKCLDKFPNLTAYIRRFEELPAIQKYMNSDSFIKGPCFGVNSGYKF